jgi:hypothetical protein
MSVLGKLHQRKHIADAYGRGISASTGTGGGGGGSGFRVDQHGDTCTALGTPLSPDGITDNAAAFQAFAPHLSRFDRNWIDTAGLLVSDPGDFSTALRARPSQ